MDESTQDVSEEAVAPETESTTDQPQESEAVAEEPKISSHDYNFREMRKIIERQQREIDELRTSMVEEEFSEPEEEVSDEEIPNVRQVRRLIEREAKRKAEELYKQKELADYETKLRVKYKDFDAVVTKENVEELIRGNTRLHNRLVKMHGEDPIEANEMAYELIKKAAFFADKQRKAAQNQSIKQTAKKNASKPVAGHALGAAPTPLQQASSFKSLSQEEKYALWKEMQGYAGQRK